jgi:hypothetical protein
MKRNPAHQPRIPGRGPASEGFIADTTSEVVTAAAISLPTGPIPTRVTGAARRARNRKVQPVEAPLPVLAVKKARPTDNTSSAQLNQTSDPQEPV